MKKCFYSVLQIDKTSTFLEIKKNYRKLVVKYHPDKNNGSKECEEKLKEINEAYECLSDSRKKAAYDKVQSEKQNEFFTSKKQYTTKTDVHKVNITLEEAFFGCTKQVNVIDKNNQYRPFTVIIPRGVSTGQTLVVSGNRFVDQFYINIFIHSHSFFEREGADLFCNITVPYIVSLDGGTVDLPWFDGVYKLNLKRDIHTGNRIPLQGMGMPILNSNKTGTLFVNIRVRGLVDFSAAILEESLCGV